MRTGRRALVLLTLLIVTAVASEEVFAGENGFLHRPRAFLSIPVGSFFYPQQTSAYPQQPQSQPAPAFNYGYFGAHVRNQYYTQKGYSGDVRDVTLPGQ